MRERIDGAVRKSVRELAEKAVGVIHQQPVFGAEVLAHMGAEVTLRPVADLLPVVRGLAGPVRIDRKSAPILLVQEAAEAQDEKEDP